MTRKKRIENPFQRWTVVESSPRVRAIVGVSVNVQENVVVPRLPDEFAALLLENGKKVVVTQITPPIGTKAPYEVVIAPDITPVRFWGASGNTFPAGGAANVAEVLRQLGIDRQVLLAPLGTGPTSRSLTSALTKNGVEHAFLKGAGTNFTLCIIERYTGRTILLCEKNLYATPPQTGEFIEQLEPDMVAMVSVRKADIVSTELGRTSLIQQLEQAFPRTTRVKRAYMPHPDMLRDPEALAEFRRLIRGVDLVQVNLGEAHFLMGRPTIGLGTLDYEAVHQLGRELLMAIMGFGPTTVVITLGAHGAVAAIRNRSGSIEVLDQRGFSAKAVDLAGAGDTHFATLLFYLWLYKASDKNGKVGVPLDRALAMASWIAARTVAHEGPTTGIPTPVRRDKALAGKKRNGRYR